jgi:hypothetical protein
MDLIDEFYERASELAVTLPLTEKGSSDKSGGIMKGLMTPSRGEWDEFIKKLAGPGACNFRDDVETWVCDNTPNRPLARRILKEMGWDDVSIEQSLGFFNAFGGNCDCEIVMNVEDSYRHYLGPGPGSPVRSQSGRNPKRKTK